MTIQDINQYKPDLIFVDVSYPKSYLGKRHFEYLNDFLENDNFKNAWKPYRYFATLEEVGFYKYHIYKRAASPVASK